MRRIALLDAPSNLGLRPPTPTSVPGCAKAPGALRDQGLVSRLRARDAGCLTPPRFDPGDWRPGDGVCQADAIGYYSPRLADRIGAIVDAGEFPVVLGGDCSILLGSGAGDEAPGGRSTSCRTAWSTSTATPTSGTPATPRSSVRRPARTWRWSTGRGQPDLTDLEQLRPYFRDNDVVLLGIRPHDDYRLDLQAAGIAIRRGAATARPKAPAGPRSGPANCSTTASASGCTSTWTCSTRR